MTSSDSLSNIKRVVVLMFENRSFDHLFGAFPGVNGLFKNGQINQAYFNLPNPLEPPSESNVPFYPAPIDPCIPQPHDFTHDFGDGMMPDLFGPIFSVTNTTYQSGFYSNDSEIQSNPGYTLYGAVGPTTTYPPTNSGFCTTYNNKQQGQSAMTYFEYGAPRILHQLAGEFVLCDNWHCDMPGHTSPNRAFMHCGQNYNGIDDPDNTIDGNHGNEAVKSVFDVINTYQGEKEFKMYVPVNTHGAQGQNDFTSLYGKNSPYQPVSICEFKSDCEHNRLPMYSFIMCWLPGTDAYTDTSMHPNALIQPGENLLAAVYNTLRQSPCWEDTLLVVNFDENGGLYDHVFPPRTVAPVGGPPAEQNVKGCCGNKWLLDSKFDFTLLGLRVPALLISPWLRKGTVDSTQYQNTSALRFVIDLMNRRFNSEAAYLTFRDASAPSLDAAFTQFGVATMRTDCPETIQAHTSLPCVDPNTGSRVIPYFDGTLSPWKSPPNMTSAPPVPYIQELLNIYIGSFPGHADSGKRIDRTFETNAEVDAYIAEREAAATKYLAPTAAVPKQSVPPN